MPKKIPKTRVAFASRQWKARLGTTLAKLEINLEMAEGAHKRYAQTGFPEMKDIMSNIISDLKNAIEYVEDSIRFLDSKIR